MLKHKALKQKGKFSFTRYFQKFESGDSVAVVRDLSFKFGYSNRLQGRTGKVLGKRGSAYYVEIRELDKPKRYVLKPIHLKKIKIPNHTKPLGIFKPQTENHNKLQSIKLSLSNK